MELISWALAHLPAYSYWHYLILHPKDKDYAKARDIYKEHFWGEGGQYYLKECEKVFKLRQSRKKTIRQRCKRILSMANPVFLTFTFDSRKVDASVSSMRKYVQRWLNANCDDYVCNIDFGMRFGRIHFHALVCSDKKMDYVSWAHEKGFLHSKKVYSSDSRKLEEYVTKFTNHATKLSTHFDRIMTKRLKRKKDLVDPSFLFDGLD